MKYFLATLMLLLAFTVVRAEKRYEIITSLDDRFTVAETEHWNVTVEKQLSLRFADVKIEPKSNSSFSLMLYFKCDTPDLSQFDTAEKIERSVRASSEKYLSSTVEKTIVLKTLNVKGWYGFYTILTDKNLATNKNIPKGEFRYITRGMVRLSKDSALGFSLMSNDLNSSEYKEVFNYILSFVKQNK